MCGNRNAAFKNNFNPRLREGGDRCISVNAERILNFNPRLREGGDDFTNDVAQRTQISIHASAREATQIFELGYHLSIHFNPRLREGGDGIEEALNKARLISIHASAREATGNTWAGVTPEENFNPRLREGGDDTDDTAITHIYRFQSTPPRGRRRELFFRNISWVSFQSTPPRGRRHWAFVNGGAIDNFNPRLREGGDIFFQHFSQSMTISIHASAREATDFQLPPHSSPRISIHASAREATSSNPSLSTGFCYFNPRLREGGDPVQFRSYRTC